MASSWAQFCSKIIRRPHPASVSVRWKLLGTSTAAPWSPLLRLLKEGVVHSTKRKELKTFRPGLSWSIPQPACQTKVCWNEEVEGSHWCTKKEDGTRENWIISLVTAETVLQGMLYLQKAYKSIEGALECNAVKDVALCEEGSDCIWGNSNLHLLFFPNRCSLSMAEMVKKIWNTLKTKKMIFK